MNMICRICGQPFRVSPSQVARVRFKVRENVCSLACKAALKAQRAAPLTVERIRQLLNYDPETGVFTRRIDNQMFKAGTEIGRSHGGGYRRIEIDGIDYMCHQLAWAHFYGVWPDREIDHEDLDRSNNRIRNLRKATRVQNSHNSAGWLKLRKSGRLKGAYPWRHKWRAAIRINKKNIHLGVFDTEAEAHAAYMEVANAHHGEFVNDGSKLAPPASKGKPRPPS